VTPASPNPSLFLVDGYAVIYRAFFAMIARPLTTAKGENTSAAWGVTNFLFRLLTQHRPDYLGWIHDLGVSFREQRYPAYKATREKLDEQLQQDFDRSVERIKQILGGFGIPVLGRDGYEADATSSGRWSDGSRGPRAAHGNRVGRQGLLSADQSGHRAPEPRARRAGGDR
jgi:DNA polymerase-1